MRLKSDLLDLIMATVEGRLGECEIEVDERPAVCVVMASPGYPGAYRKGARINGLAKAAKVADAAVFHAGTTTRGGHTVTAGGRVLGVTALGDTVREAFDRAYRAVGLISFEGGEQYRHDIGYLALRREAAQASPPNGFKP
jgi:phosphoribosylamine--glycine ligase